jgi:hypothetical protein
VTPPASVDKRVSNKRSTSKSDELDDDMTKRKKAYVEYIQRSRGTPPVGTSTAGVTSSSNQGVLGGGGGLHQLRGFLHFLSETAEWAENRVLYYTVNAEPYGISTLWWIKKKKKLTWAEKLLLAPVEFTTKHYKRIPRILRHSLPAIAILASVVCYCVSSLLTPMPFSKSPGYLSGVPCHSILGVTLQPYWIVMIQTIVSQLLIVCKDLFVKYVSQSESFNGSKPAFLGNTFSSSFSLEKERERESLTS